MCSSACAVAATAAEEEEEEGLSFFGFSFELSSGEHGDSSKKSVEIACSAKEVEIAVVFSSYAE